MPGANFQSMLMHGTPFVPIDLTYVTTPTVDTTDLTTYSFAGVSIGTADATRRVIVAVGWFSTTARTLSSATIAGVSATIHVTSGAGAGGRFNGCALISAQVPTGTTASIDFTLSGAASWGIASVYRQVGEHTSTPHATTSDNTLSVAQDDYDLLINIPSSGAVVAAAVTDVNGGTPTGYAWTNAVEDFENASIETNGIWGSASQDGLSTETNRAVTCVLTSSTGTGVGCSVAMSWG